MIAAAGTSLNRSNVVIKVNTEVVEILFNLDGNVERIISWVGSLC